MLTPIYQYAAMVEKHTDGDTFHSVIDLGLRTYVRWPVRVRGIDTPEKNSKNAAERAHAAEALAFLVSKIPVGAMVILQTAKPAVYNRVEADVFYVDTDGQQYNLAEQLRLNGFAKLASYPV